MILRFGVVGSATESVMDESFDGIPHALIEPFDEMSGDLLWASDLVDDLSPEEAKLELLCDKTAELSGARAGESRQGNTGPGSGREVSGFVVCPALDLTIDHLIIGVGGRASHDVTSDRFSSVYPIGLGRGQESYRDGRIST